MRHSFGLDAAHAASAAAACASPSHLFDPAEVRRLLCYLRCFSDPLPVSPSRGPPDWPDTLEFP